MEIQNYNQRYEQAVVDLWNACLPCDPLTLQKFRKQALLDDNFDPSLCYVALADQEIVAISLPSCSLGIALLLVSKSPTKPTVPSSSRAQTVLLVA